MPSIPALAPRFTLNLIDGDQFSLRLTLRDKKTKARKNLTDWKAALQVRKAPGEAVILTLATAGHPQFTSSTGCSIVLLDQTVEATKGQADLIFDLEANALTISQFNAAEQTDGSLRYLGVFDLRMRDAAGLDRKYARGPAEFITEVTALP